MHFSIPKGRRDLLVETYFWIDDESGNGRFLTYSKVLCQSLIDRLWCASSVRNGGTNRKKR
jgi:hypothetical protein